jgi:hypothetical protein
MEFDPILHDFNVDILSETQGQNLYGKAGDLFFHFILVRKNNRRGYQTLTQFFFPRLGFSLAMLARLESPKNPVAGFSKKDLFPEYLQDYYPAGQETKNGPEFFLDFGGGPLSLGKKEPDTVTSAILDDGIWFKNFAATREAVSAKAFLDAKPKPKGIKSREDLLQKAGQLHVLPDLEYELSVGGPSNGLSKGKRKQKGLLDLLIFALTAKADISEELLHIWIVPLSIFGKQTTCGCSDTYCFFEIGKKIQLRYFPDTYDNPEVVKAFWENLSPEQKAILLFMEDVVGLSPLVAQDIFEEDFNIGYLSELLCQGHQPDSPYELQVRKYIAIANYLWKKSNYENDGGRYR